MTPSPESLRIGLASARNYPTFEERLDCIDRFLTEAGEQQVAIVCFPEAYLPGLRGQSFAVPPYIHAHQEAALDRIGAMARSNNVAVVMGMEWQTTLGLHNVAFVINRDGAIAGYQTKNQIPLEEAPWYVPDRKRRMFDVDGVPFGITICHEGWRYPEATRWASRRGARIVFHPQLTGSDDSGPTLTRWGDADNPYYEKAMTMRSVENTIYFASVNYGFKYQESATSIIGPEGDLISHAPYGQECLLTHEIDLAAATGLIANRYDPDLYPD